MKSVAEMTREDFLALPDIENSASVYRFDSMVVIPAPDGAELHDSGFRFITVVAVVGKEPTFKLTMCSDVLHLDGIGGLTAVIHKRNWYVDCLPKSGLFHFWSPGCTLYVEGCGYSSFEVFRVAKEEPR